MGKKHPNITNLDEVEARKVQKGSKFSYSAKRLGALSGGQSLGCSWFEIEPGRTSFPHHFHCANEEAIFILDGRGEMRINENSVTVEKNDYIAFPVGPEHSHSLKNIGTTPLRYLCFSTLIPTEVVGYPDSKKVAAVGSKDISKGIFSTPDVWIRLLVKEQVSVDYYDGEEIS